MRTTGKTLEQWFDTLSKSKYNNRKQVKEWFSIKYHLPDQHTTFILRRYFNGENEHNTAARIDVHFTEEKKYLKPVYNKIIFALRTWGNFRIKNNKTYISLLNGQQFAILKITVNGLVLGLPQAAIRKAKAKGFVSAAGLGTEKISHKIVLLHEKEVNKPVLDALRYSFLGK
jgi:hypothetical protein